MILVIKWFTSNIASKIIHIIVKQCYQYKKERIKYIIIYFIL